MAEAIEARELSVMLGTQPILRSATFSVPENIVCALLGPNGAGKTTLSRTMMNIYQPQNGSVYLLGTRSTELEPRHFEQIGYVSESQEVPQWMTVQNFLALCASMYPSWDHSWQKELVRDLGLPLNFRLQDLSRGMLVKAKLISSLAYKPRLLVLDEPFSGLDPVVRDEFIALVVELCEKSHSTVFISSHDLHEVERVAEATIFLADDEVREQAPLDTLLERYRHVDVAFRSPAVLPKTLPRSWKKVEHNDSTVRFVHTNFSPVDVQNELQGIAAGAEITSVSELSLKEIYRVVME